MSNPEDPTRLAAYFHSQDPSALHANQALARLQQESLSPVPQNYELWFAYYAQTHLDVVHALDTLSTAQQPITDTLCEDLHQRFLSEAKNNETVRETGARIQATLTGMSSRVDAARAATHQYKEALQTAASQLGAPGESEQIRSTLRTVLDNTSDMLAHNQQLEDALAQSSLMMQALERDLEAVRKQSLTDGLTLLANRKAFDAEIARLSQQAQANGPGYCMVMMDIDHFKVFNDTYGHQVGDDVLRLVARTLGQCVRSGDMAARYGGEEFAILLPGATLPLAMKLADRLRATIEGMSLTRRKSGDKLGRVTLSGGVAEVVAGETPDALVARADAALYLAKSRGRNRIEVHAGGS
jgi:diguanylate cyclase